MNLEMLNERDELETNINELNHFIRVTDDFLKRKTEYYTYPESIEALKSIRNILTTKEEECKKLESRIHIVKKSLVESCNHEIIFGDELNTFCAICQTLIIYTPETSKLEITIPGQWENPIIKSDNEFNDKYLRNIISEIGKNFASHENLTIVEEAFEELQYSSNIKIRRLNP